MRPSCSSNCGGGRRDEFTGLVEESLAGRLAAGESSRPISPAILGDLSLFAGWKKKPASKITKTITIFIVVVLLRVMDLNASRGRLKMITRGIKKVIYFSMIL